MRTLKTATGFYAEAAKINKHTKPNKTLLVRNSYSYPCLVKENPDKGVIFPHDNVTDGRWSFCPVALDKCLRYCLTRLQQLDANLADCR